LKPLPTQVPGSSPSGPSLEIVCACGALARNIVVVIGLVSSFSGLVDRT
jgi:hypothetical protein